MKTGKIRIYILLLIAVLGIADRAFASDDGSTEQRDYKWIDLFFNNDSIQRVRSYDLKDKVKITFDESGLVNDDGEVLYDSLVVSGSNGPAISFSLDDFDYAAPGRHVPTIRLNLENPIFDVVSKTEYEPGVMTLKTDDMDYPLGPIPIKVKGRGNTTWNWPKKPYRLKSLYKIKILDLPATSDFVLLANYCDDTLLRNSVAFEAGRLLGLPYNIVSVPVEVYFNDDFKGSYLLTTKPSIGPHCVDIDRKQGILWELSNRGDELWQYQTPIYSFFMMVKDPDVEEAAAMTGMSPQSYMEQWENDFNEIEEAVKNGDPWSYIDLEDFVKYVIVQNLSTNYDFSGLGSVFAYKANKEDKLHFGPLWDFDKAFNYSMMTPSHRYLLYHPMNVFYPGEIFFRDLVMHPDFAPAFETFWEDFRDDKLPQLLEFIDEEAARIKVSALRDGEKYPESENYKNLVGISTENFDKSVENLKKWIIEQADLITNDPSFYLIRNVNLRSGISE